MIPLADAIPSNSDSDSTAVVLADTTPSNSDSEPTATKFIDVFQSMGYALSEDEVTEWLNNDQNDPGYEHLHDDECFGR